jgi:hypothetical protein
LKGVQHDFMMQPAYTGTRLNMAPTPVWKEDRSRRLPVRPSTAVATIAGAGVGAAIGAPVLAPLGGFFGGIASRKLADRLLRETVARKRENYQEDEWERVEQEARAEEAARRQVERAALEEWGMESMQTSRATREANERVAKNHAYIADLLRRVEEMNDTKYVSYGPGHREARVMSEDEKLLLLEEVERAVDTYYKKDDAGEDYLIDNDKPPGRGWGHKGLHKMRIFKGAREAGTESRLTAVAEATKNHRKNVDEAVRGGEKFTKKGARYTSPPRSSVLRRGSALGV